MPGCAVLLDQRQHHLEALVLPGHRVDQSLALVCLQTGLQGGHDGRIDGQRHIADGLNELDGLGQDLSLVRERDACVDVQHVGARLHLRAGVGLDAAIVTPSHLGREHPAPRGIDAFTDDDERPLEADRHLLGS
jgi:hypothetical protein